MRRPLLTALAALTVLASAIAPAEARRGGGGSGHWGGGGGHWGGGGGQWRGGHWGGGRGYGWGRPGLALGLGVGVGAALAYRGWWGGAPGYAFGYPYPYEVAPPVTYYAPPYPEPIQSPPPAAPVSTGRPAEARNCRAAMQVTCRLQQPTPLGGACGCISNMGMLPGQAMP